MVPNYYEILGVAPDADRASIERALAACQPIWSAGTRNPKKKHEYQSYLDQIPQIRRTLLSDEDVRQAYDAELFAEQRAAEETRIAKLEVLVRLRSARGGLNAADRRALAAEAQGLGVDGAVLDRMLVDSPMLTAPDENPIDDEETLQFGDDALDPTSARQIELVLNHLGFEHLYAMLNLPRDAPRSELLAAITAVRRRWMQKSQVTAEKTAWLEAVSYANTYLVAPDARRRYDATLESRADAEFESAVSFAVNGLPRLDDATFEALVEHARATGISPNRADQVIQRVCTRLGVVRLGSLPVDVALPQVPASQRVALTRCRSCHGFNENIAKPKSGRPGPLPTCRHCGEPLWWTCPSCRISHRVDRRRCRCGFRQEHRLPVVRHRDLAQIALRARQYARALEHLDRVLPYASRMTWLHKAHDLVKQRMAERDKARDRCTRELQARNLQAAQTALEDWEQREDPNDLQLVQTRSAIQAELRKAAALIPRAEGASVSDPAEARRLYRHCLTIVRDSTEARNGLHHCPPDPPHALNLRRADIGIELTWSSPISDGLGPIEFLIVRKPEVHPRTPNDGRIVTRTIEAVFHDADAPHGRRVGYAVYASRNGRTSLTAAVAGPIVALGRPRNLRADLDDGEVHLTWTPPQDAMFCRVVRKLAGRPQSPEDGTPVRSGLDYLHEVGLENDRLYHYAVFAQFLDAEGQTLTGPPAFISVTPGPPGPIVEQIDAQFRQPNRVSVSWSKPAKGKVRVLRTSRPLTLEPGRQIRVAEAERLQTWIHEPTLLVDVVDREPPPTSPWIYTAFTWWSGMATVGASVELRPDDRHRNAHSGSTGSNGLEHRVARPDHPRATALDVPGRGGPIDPAPASTPAPRHLDLLDGQAPTLSYQFKPQFRWNPFGPRRWRLALAPRPEGITLPPLVLVGHPRTVPITASEGNRLLQLQAIEGARTLDLPPHIDPDRLKIRLFIDPKVEPDGIPHVEIQHADREPTRI